MARYDALKAAYNNQVTATEAARVRRDWYMAGVHAANDKLTPGQGMWRGIERGLARPDEEALRVYVRGYADSLRALEQKMLYGEQISAVAVQLAMELAQTVIPEQK